MRGLDWLLVAVALLAMGDGVLFNGPLCQFISGNVEFPGPYPCRPIFPGPFLIGLAVAASAVAVLAVKVRRRRIGDR